MTAELLVLLPVSVACDIFGQIFFKIGSGGRVTRTGLPQLPPLAWIGMGMAVYVLEIFVWLRVLSLAPLTLAAPIASLNYLGVVLAGLWLFDERIAPRQWAGAGLITLGAIAVALTGG
jgi:drug/metabolite transporter (DMT)-like permease